MLEPGQNPHTGPMCWEVPLTSTTSEQHYPFWVLPTEMVTTFASTQAARFVLPLDHIFLHPSRRVAQASSSSLLDPVRQILGFYTAQLLCCLLIYSVDDEQEYGFDNWIWKSTWQVKYRSRGNSCRKEQSGLGLGNSVHSSGTLWIPDGHFD
ncbi:hypothetical protein DER46DRAFT_659175 [Fusarium sp. MPI-SDFR-AT-0072]|nr:hypothetical protein DER46DRAFT_659175 [Fusarium sp. MPI-SDFR-AT-0072]